MEDAELINNIPCCKLCHRSLGGISDYDVVEYEGKRYIQFIRRCNTCRDKKGQILYQYCTKELGGNRVVFPNKDIKKIKTVKVEINEKEIENE